MDAGYTARGFDSGGVALAAGVVLVLGGLRRK
jgi:hypothetical protein